MRERSSAVTQAGVWQLAWPTILSNMLQSLVGLIDISAVGTLGALSVAAVASGQRVFFTLQAVLFGIGAGTTALVARAWGAGDRVEAARVLRRSIVIAVTLGLATSALGALWSGELAGVLGLSGEARNLASVYIRWTTAFAGMFAISFVLMAALRAAGDARTPLAIGVIANVLNVLLLYTLVRGGLGFPKLGVTGAALAGGLAFSCACLFGLVLLAARRLCLPLAAADPQPARTLWVLKIGAPAALESLIVQGSFIVFNIIIARYYGTDALAAYAIGVQVLMFSIIVGYGFSTAAAALVGQHLGAGDPEAAVRSGWRATWLAGACMTFVSLCLVAGAEWLARLVIADEGVVRRTVVFMRILGLAQPLMAIDFALTGALRGAGDTRFPLLSSSAGLVGGRLLLAAVFVWQKLSVEWVYSAILADYAVRVSLLLVRFRSGRWRDVLPEPAAVHAMAVEDPVT